jgi:hypothetical protein
VEASDSGRSSPDAGSEADAGVAVDSGVAADSGTTDAGIDDDAGPLVDAGADVDAGLAADAGSAPDGGAPDAGPVPLDAGLFADAGPEAITLTVAANPNSVLSAVATASWTGELQYLTLIYAQGQTPPFPVSEATSPATLPILGLAASTSYTFQAIGEDFMGNLVQSNEATLQTGPLPAGVPVFSAQGTPSGTGLTLVARLPSDTTDTDYLTIVDGSGAPVWYYLLPDNEGAVGDFQQQPDGTYTMSVNDPSTTINGLVESVALYDQIDVLGNLLHTWKALGPDGQGNPVVDTSGNVVKVLATDAHEMRIRPDGSALLFGFVSETMDLRAYGGFPAATVVGDVFENVTVAGQVTFAWNALEHFGPADQDPAAAVLSTATVDLTHGNAIEVASDGNYLLSFRNVSQIVKVDSRTGDIIWQLGGAGISSPEYAAGPMGDFIFVNDPLGGFSCQHGVRELPNGDLIVFDDGNCHPGLQSRAVEYALDTEAMTATFVWDTTPQTDLYTYILGYAQRLSNGNTVTAFGVRNLVIEWDPSGQQQLWTLTDSSHPFGLYRAYRLDSLYTYAAP